MQKQDKALILGLLGSLIVFLLGFSYLIKLERDMNTGDDAQKYHITIGEEAPRIVGFGQTSSAPQEALDLLAKVSPDVTYRIGKSGPLVKVLAAAEVEGKWYLVGQSDSHENNFLIGPDILEEFKGN